MEEPHGEEPCVCVRRIMEEPCQTRGEEPCQTHGEEPLPKPPTATGEGGQVSMSRRTALGALGRRDARLRMHVSLGERVGRIKYGRP
jgi:hypothetical protein